MQQDIFPEPTVSEKSDTFHSPEYVKTLLTNTNHSVKRDMWLMEEIGELAAALRGDDRENLAEEFADVIAWLATIANVANIDLNAALITKYGNGCPGCSRLECICPSSEKP